MRNVVFDRMPSVPLESFRPELRFEFPDIPDQLFDAYLRLTAIDMAWKAPLVRRSLTIHMLPGVTRYDITPEDGTTMRAILRASLSSGGGCGVRDIPRFSSEPGGPCGEGIWYDAEEKVLHTNTPCECGSRLRVVMAVVPSSDSCELPVVYRDDVYPTLIMGTRARLLMISGRPWTNMRVGGELHNEYNRMLGRDSVRKHMGRQAGIVRMDFGPVM